MHPFSIDTKEREEVLFFLAVLSIISIWLGYRLLDYFKIVLPWWFEAPSTISFYWFLFFLFDNYMWKLKFLKFIVKTPNLNGEWIGHIKSSFDNYSSKKEAKLKIRQSWTAIEISLDTDESNSHTETGSIITDTTKGNVLIYQYLSEPKMGSKGTMHIHYGTGRLTMKENELVGEYYSGRDRQNFGEVYFRKI